LDIIEPVPVSSPDNGDGGDDTVKFHPEVDEA
jgi:hypothetical protein